PGAAYGPAKQWPVDNFRQVADAWTAEGGRVVVVGTNAERDAAVEIIDPRSNNLNLCGKTSLSQLMAVLKTVALCVANDSGAMHLAAGLGTPGVAIFGSTNPDATGPLGAPWVVLANPPACAPCFARECQRPANRYQCLTAITPDHVMQALTFLEKRRHVA
ncbi:MAG: glycosyltransferase family 9 protein, partial [Candidatus Pacebacteria bacterium]|nr:glycosyltransferase family 9 protein [Candidatus Paceibacterota bacterium]